MIFVIRKITGDEAVISRSLDSIEDNSTI